MLPFANKQTPICRADETLLSHHFKRAQLYALYQCIAFIQVHISKRASGISPDARLFLLLDKLFLKNSPARKTPFCQKTVAFRTIFVISSHSVCCREKENAGLLMQTGANDPLHGGTFHQKPKIYLSSFIFSTARKASLGTSTVPNWRMRFLPSFCFSKSFFLRVMSPP